jgi:DNA-binding transcriptional MerR regulator
MWLSHEREATMTHTIAKLTFTLAESAKLCGLTVLTLRHWVHERFVVPVYKGGRGTGNGHRFSTRQLYAIVAINSLITSPRGCNREYARALWRAFDALPDELLETWTTGKEDDYQEEAIAKWQSTPLGAILSGQQCTCCSREPGDEERSQKVTEACERIAEAVRVRLGLSRPGVGDQRSEASKAE